MAAQIAPSTIADVLLRYVNATNSSGRDVPACNFYLNPSIKEQLTVCSFNKNFSASCKKGNTYTVYHYILHQIRFFCKNGSTQKDNAEAGHVTERLQHIFFFIYPKVNSSDCLCSRFS